MRPAVDRALERHRPKRTQAHRMRRAGFACLLCLGFGATSFAQPADAPLVSEPPAAVTPAAPAADDPNAITLAAYMDALVAQRLLAEETGSDRRLQGLVRRGEALYFDHRYDAAALVLYEVVESPRFRDFSELDEYVSAELLIASALAELGSLRSAARYLERILARGSDHAYFGPAYRRFVDVTLQSGDLSAGLTVLETVGEGLPEDALNELRYLRGRAAYDAANYPEAEAVLSEVTRRSRFFANAQYLRGVVATRLRHYDEAEARFCSIATTEDQDRFTFYVDDRYFQVKDLAWMALGRVAHEGLRSNDAFYYYFQVPNDSERVAEALFEAAYAMYEGDDQDTAYDLLDQLEARFPASPFVDEAMLLRGYVHLGRCEFEEANQLFVRYAERFRPLVDQIATILASPTRQRSLYADLLAEDRRRERVQQRREREGVSEDQAAEEDRASLSTLEGLLLALLRVDPRFFELHANVRTLDAEAARSGRLASDLRGLATRLGGTDRPRAAAEQERYEEETDELRRELEAGRDLLAGMARQLDVLRRAPNADRSEVTALETRLQELTGRVDELGGQLTSAIAATARALDVGGEDPATEDVRRLLRRDAARARALPERVRVMRERLVESANEAALRSLRRLHERLGGSLRRARIGRIDAVMGSKRRIEIQIESLAAGRFPPELIDPLRIQGLLRDDEEYWPFEGEYWSDEFDETVALEDVEDDEDDGDDE